MRGPASASRPRTSSLGPWPRLSSPHCPTSLIADPVRRQLQRSRSPIATALSAFASPASGPHSGSFVHVSERRGAGFVLAFPLRATRSDNERISRTEVTLPLSDCSPSFSVNVALFFFSQRSACVLIAATPRLDDSCFAVRPFARFDCFFSAESITPPFPNRPRGDCHRRKSKTIPLRARLVSRWVWRHSMPLCGSPQPRRTRNMRKSAESRPNNLASYTPCYVLLRMNVSRLANKSGILCLSPLPLYLA